MDIPDTHDTPQQRIDRALALAVRFGGRPTAHHKAWVIDQMVRALTGCPSSVHPVVSDPYEAAPYGYAESQAYIDLVRDTCSDGTKPDAYEWDTGIPP